MTTTKTPVGIRAQGLTKRYGDKVAVDDLSFTAEPGVITGFLGPNGAGKSTIGGRHIAELDEPARTVGALLDARALHPRRTAFDHLLAMAQTAGLGRKRVGEVLDLVGLADAATR